MASGITIDRETLERTRAAVPEMPTNSSAAREALTRYLRLVECEDLSEAHALLNYWRSSRRKEEGR